MHLKRFEEEFESHAHKLDNIGLSIGEKNVMVMHLLIHIHPKFAKRMKVGMFSTTHTDSSFQKKKKDNANCFENRAKFH